MSEKNLNQLIDDLLFDNEEFKQINNSAFQKCKEIFIEEYAPSVIADSFIKETAYQRSYEKNYNLAKEELKKKKSSKTIYYSFITLAASLIICWFCFFYSKNSTNQIFTSTQANISKEKKNEIIPANTFSNYIIPPKDIDISKYLIKSQPIKLSDFIIDSKPIDSCFISSHDIVKETYLMNEEELYAFFHRNNFGYMKTKDSLVLIAQNGHPIAANTFHIK